MMPDAGTSRADCPGGDARQLYHSIRDLLALPDETTLFVGHDYCPDGRKVACAATVAEHRRDNKHVHDGVDEAEFVALRQRRHVDPIVAVGDRPCLGNHGIADRKSAVEGKGW